MTDNIRVRPARSRDLPAISTILAEGFQDKFTAAFGQQADKAGHILERCFALDAFQGLPGLYVAELDGQVVGTFALRRHRQAEMPLLDSMGIFFEELGLWGGLRAMFYLSLLDQSIRQEQAYVSDVAVAGPARRRGVGRAMLQYAETVGRAWGKSALVLDVNAANEDARRLYQRLGYEDAKIRRSLLTYWLLGIGKWVRMRKRL